MRALKITAIVIGSLLVLLVGGALALLAFVDPNDYRDDIERLAEEKLGRDLTIGGGLDLDFFPWLALRIEKVSLGNPPGYGEQPFATVEQASVGVKLVPLLRREVEVSRVAVEGLNVGLVSRSDNENNWQDLAKEDEAAEPGEATASPTIGGIDVTRAQLVYRDEAEDSTLRIANLELHAGRMGGEQAVPLQLEFDLERDDSKAPLHVRLETLARLPADATRVELADVNVEGRHGDTPFSVRSPSLQLDWDLERLEPAELAVTFGALPMRVTAAGEQLFGSRVVAGRIAVSETKPRDVLRSLGIESPTTRDPEALSTLALKGHYRLTENALSVSNLDLTVDQTRVRGSAGIEDLEKFVLAFDLAVDRVDVDRYLEPEAKRADGGSPPSSDAASEEPTKLPTEALREMNANGRLRVGQATLSGLAFTDVQLTLDATSGLVRLGPTSARLFGGQYAGNTVLDARPAQARLSLDERVTAIDIGQVMQATFDTSRLSGRGNASARLEGVGNTDAAILRSLSGRTEFDVRDGAFNGVDLWYELRRARALWKRETVPERSGPQRTTFNTFKGTAALDAGIVRNDDLRIETDYLRASGKGTIDLGSQEIDYRLVAVVYELPAEGAGSELTELKAAEIPITITGTFENPKVRPDLGALVKARVKKEVDSEIEERKEEVKKKITDKLRDLLDR